MICQLKVDIHVFWHAGSGRGDGMAADAVVVRTPGGLPYIPGRTLKGLLREAAQWAEDLGHVQPAGWTAALFGSPLPPLLDPTAPAKAELSYEAEQAANRFDTEPGCLRISNAKLGATTEEQTLWEAWARRPQGGPAAVGQHGAHARDPHLRDYFYRRFASTALKNGVADRHKLRAVEMVVPVTLYAFVDVDDRRGHGGKILGDWIGVLRTSVLPLVRALGKERTRGLGRCRLEWIGEEKQT